MTTLYQPPVNTLGIMAPVLGPWFTGGNAMPILPALPGPANLPTQLHVPVALNNTNWLPPATGNLSLYYVQNNAVPPALDTLRNIDGNNPFAPTGVYAGQTRLVAWFRLLPEVEQRLHQCLSLLPAPTAAALGAAAPVAGVPSRPQVRSFMMVFPNAGVTTGFIDAMFNGGLDGDDVFERMNCVGLVTADGVNITGNMALPMTHLRRPGGQSPDTLVANMTAQVDLWCFDRRGRPIDPGAVACWWSWLLNYGIGETVPGNGNFQLLAPNIQAANLATPGAVLAPVPAAGAPASLPHVANFAPGLTAHLVNPHEGVLGAPFLAVDGDTADTNNVQRLTLSVGGAAIPNPTGSLAGGGAGGNIVVNFTAAPTVSVPAPAGGAPTVPYNPPADNAPLARVAVLPGGPYAVPAAAGVTLWAAGPLHTNLTRDFVRVAVVDEEAFLVGYRRRRSDNAPANPAFPDGGTLLPGQLRREMDQNRPSTRITVAPSAAPVLRATSGAVAAAMLTLPNAAANPARLVLGVTDTAWGAPVAPAGLVAPVAAANNPFPAALADAANTPPAVLAMGQYRVLPLQGDGGQAADRQLVLLEANLGPACAGASVRAWPLGFNLATGNHFRLTGGAAVTGANGIAFAVLALPNGLANPVGQLRFDLQAVIPRAGGGSPFTRRYAALPFNRPAALGGAPVAANALAGGWVVCETGLVGAAPPLAPGSIPAGAHVVQTGAPAVLVDRNTIAVGDLVGTLANYLTANPTALLSLTEPAFGSTADRADSVGRPLAKARPSVPAPGAQPGDLPPGQSGPGGGVLGLAGNGVHLLGRGAAEAGSASLPLGLMNRQEVVGASLGAAAQAAVIGASPPVPWALEPATNHFLGYPGVPASIEVHGAGAVLSGGAAIAAGEYVRERTAGLGIAAFQGVADPTLRGLLLQSEVALVAEASITLLPPAAAVAAPSPVVAVLRTSAMGVEGLPLVCQTIRNNGYYPTLTNVLDTFYVWLNNNIPVPPGIPAGGPAPGQLGTWLSNQNPPATNALAACRALDRRIQSSVFGSREALYSLVGAINRAEDLIYIETPELDNLVLRCADGDPNAASAENVSLWQVLLARVNARPGLRVVLCVSSLPAPGTPQRLREVRDQSLLDAITAARTVAGARFVVFAPGVGAGRALRLASTSVVVDDAYALTGSTHLSRRGLSWDTSLAAAVFDETLVDGRPADVLAFRNQLLADRLGIPLAAVPLDAAELVRAISDLDTQGSNRLSAVPIMPPATAVTPLDQDVWLPDGSLSSAERSDLPGWSALFLQSTALTDPAHAITEG
jgi:hypothetical protein